MNLRRFILFASVTAIIVLLTVFGLKQLNRGGSTIESLPDVITSDTEVAVHDESFVTRFANYTDTANNLNIEMIAVQGGTFTMGCISEQGDDCYESEKPAHQVTVSDFYIGKYEVTQEQWKIIMGNNPSKFPKGDNYPVENVSWNHVMGFIRRLNALTGRQYRLPTEAEWEFAARGGNNSKGYRYSGDNTAGNVAWYSDNLPRRTNSNTGNGTQPVGAKSANELGLYDMSGNVWEWCNDWYGPYSSDTQSDPQGPSSGTTRVMRGGSWMYKAKDTRVTVHGYCAPGLRYDDLGFRLACSTK